MCGGMNRGCSSAGGVFNCIRGSASSVLRNVEVARLAVPNNADVYSSADSVLKCRIGSGGGACEMQK